MRSPEQPDDAGPLELSSEESLVLLQAGEATTVEGLALATGLPAHEVRSALGRLSSLGLLPEVPGLPRSGAPVADARAPAALASSSAARPPTAFAFPPAEDASLDAALRVGSDEADAGAEPGAATEAQTSADLETAAEPELDEAPWAAADRLRAERDPANEGGAEAQTSESDAGVQDEALEQEQEQDQRAAEADYRRLFESELRPLPPEQRARLAQSASGSTLLALCFDPDGHVVRAVLQNPVAAFDHARLVARHHRTSSGLDAVVSRADFARDTQVRRALLRNPALGEPFVRRLLGKRRLAEIYRTTLDRDVPDRTRTAARGVLRTRFATAEPEERFDLVWSTEGRVLALLTGLTFDARTASMICARNVVSVMLVQTLARFPATPPLVLAHLLRQPLLKRQPHLRNMVLQHPNVPGESKRKG